MTYSQIAQKLGLKTNSVKARISEIKKADLPIEETKIGKQKAYSMSIDYKSKILKQPY
jgi:predicted transcriptional regulator